MSYKNRSHWRNRAVILGVFALIAAAQPPVDQKLLFHYVKYMERWPADSELKVQAIAPSKVMPGLFEVTVVRSRSGRNVGERRYFVAADGQHFLKGDTFQINETPFDTRIARLAKQVSPSIGPEKAPVTISVFEDFQCPDCADASKLLSEQLTAEFGNQVRIVFHDFRWCSISGR